MNFITIDFETATGQRDSPCELGLTFVENNKIVDVKSWLIKPFYKEFDSYNMLIHGITPEHVKDQPNFGDLWNEIRPLIEGKFLIAHNASFDMSVLRRTLELYNLPFPNLQYSCSYIFSKNIWKSMPAYDLKSLCWYNEISLNHHRAAYDSEATAKLCLKAFELSDVTCIEDFPYKLRTSIGRLYDGGYQPSNNRRIDTRIRQKNKASLSEIIGDPSKINIDSMFYEKGVVFTGALLSMSRTIGQQIIADIGGVNQNGVTKNTDYLIVGQQDYRVVGDDGMSKKQEKAVKMIDEGFELEILSEEDFIKNL